MNYAPVKIALVATLVSVAISVYLISVPGTPRFSGADESLVQAAINRMPIDMETEKQIGDLESSLAGLGLPRIAADQGLDLAVLGYAEIIPVTPAPIPKPVLQPAPQPDEYVVSMTYVSMDQRFAVIDGRFYREGGRLPRGESILAITPSAVRVESRDLVRSLRLETDPETFSLRGGVIKTDIPDSEASSTPGGESSTTHPEAS